MKLVIKKAAFLPIKICYNENWVVSTSEVAKQLYNTWDTPKQMNWIMNWICPFSKKKRLLEECCKVILISRVRGWDVSLILLPSNINMNNKDIIPLKSSMGNNIPSWFFFPPRKAVN